MASFIDRRKFMQAGAGALAAGASFSFEGSQDIPQGPRRPDPVPRVGQLPYHGPRVILIRFGGGVRRRETIADAAHTYCPFVLHELVGRKGGILFPNVEMENRKDTVVTSHGQGTLYILTGRYDRYEDIQRQAFAERFIPQVPTLFECFREKYNVPDHEALIINGEDRINEEFFTFSNTPHYGVRYRSTVLSLYRFKTFLFREQLEARDLTEAQRADLRRRLEQMENLDYRVENRQQVANAHIDRFWGNWRSYYGSSGFVNPRGDSLLTTLALRAIRELRPKLMMVNYQDPDYVHWGNRTFYTRAIATIDDGIRQIYDATQADDEYRDNTVFVIIPDCGRDDNRAMAVPFQHHFNTRSAHEIFTVIAGPERGPNRLFPRPFRPNIHDEKAQQQVFVARTVGDIMGFETPNAASESLLARV